MGRYLSIYIYDIYREETGQTGDVLQYIATDLIAYMLMATLVFSHT